MTQTFKYAIENGIVAESDYAYTGVEGECDLTDLSTAA